MAFYSLISYKDPKIGAWTIPQAIQGADKESLDFFRQNMERTIKAGKIEKSSDGLECYRIGVFDDDTGKIHLLEQPEHIIDLHAPKDEHEARA